MESCSFPGIKNIPESLFKYVSAKRALEILLTQKIYFAHRFKFNDPLDGAFSAEKSGKIEKIPTGVKLVGDLTDYVKDAQKKLDEVNLGFFSMSENDMSYPMWAHYANQHKGCCLEFNFKRFQSRYNGNDCFPFVFVGKVDYTKNLPGISVAKKRIPHEKGSIYMTKYKDWEYEKEWRAVMYNGEYNPFDEVLFDLESSFFEAMDGSGSYEIEKKFIAKIILGSKMETSEREAVIAAAKQCDVEFDDVKIGEYR